MKTFVHQWVVTLGSDDENHVHGLVTGFDCTTRSELVSFESCGSSKTVLEELGTVLDASMFTSLAIAEGLVPEGQQPLL